MFWTEDLAHGLRELIVSVPLIQGILITCMINLRLRINSEPDLSPYLNIQLPKCHKYKGFLLSKRSFVSHRNPRICVFYEFCGFCSFCRLHGFADFMKSAIFIEICCFQSESVKSIKICKICMVSLKSTVFADFAIMRFRLFIK